MGERTARCYRCGEQCPLSLFPPDRSKASGRASICRPCDRKKGREYYARNRERKIAATTARQHTGERRKRKCKRCGNPAASQRHHYCHVCRAWAQERSRVRRASPTRTPWFEQCEYCDTHHARHVNCRIGLTHDILDMLSDDALHRWLAGEALYETIGGGAGQNLACDTLPPRSHVSARAGFPPASDA